LTGKFVVIFWPELPSGFEDELKRRVLAQIWRFAPLTPSIRQTETRTSGIQNWAWRGNRQCEKSAGRLVDSPNGKINAWRFALTNLGAIQIVNRARSLLTSRICTLVYCVIDSRPAPMLSGL